MFRKPRWSVTWPTRPSGGYSVAFDYEPQVWRLLRPYRLRSHPVAGPDFPDQVLGEIAFTPWPLPKADA
jgi:hypothetical protein